MIVKVLRRTAKVVWALGLAIPFLATACDGTLPPGGALGQVACPAPDHPPAAICGASVCGNGVRDSCQVCEVGPESVGCADLGLTNGPGCGPPSCLFDAQESCDGADLGTSSCATLGFAGGTLACSDRCTFQTNGCNTCLAGAEIVACRHTEVEADDPGSVAIAATDSEVVVAWVPGPGLTEKSDSDAGSVRLARFDGSLSLVAQTGCFGPQHASNVAIARTPSGYLLAIEGDGGVTVQALDPTLAPTGGSRVIADASFPTLTARESAGAIVGGPLLTWTETLPPSGISAEAMGAPLDDSGAEEATPATLFADESFVGSAAFTGDAFLVSSTVRHDFIAHLTLDGTVTIPENTAIAAGSYPENAQLVWNGTGGTVIFAQNPGWFWAPIDASGALSGAPVALDLGTYPRVSLARGDEMWIIGASGTGGVDLAFTRISAAGSQVMAPVNVVADPEVPFLPVVAGLGSDMALAWVGGTRSYPGRIGLALLSP